MLDENFKDYFLNIIQKNLGANIYRLSDNGLGCDLVLVKSWLFRTRLISIGYLTDGGIEGDPNICQKNLLKQIKGIAEQHKVHYVEFRGGIKPQIDNIIERKNIYANFIKDLSEIDIYNIVSRKKRACIRKAMENPDLSFIDNVSVDDFYRVFSHAQHSHGTPIHKKSFYQALNSNPDINKIYGIAHKGEIVAVCMVFITDTQLIAYYGGADRHYAKMHAYDLLYYQLMKLAKEKGLLFNFGRSKYDTGSFKYKKLWCFEPSKTTHYIWPISDKPIPDLRANNPEYSKKIAIWRKLPRWLVNLIGPYVLKQIG